MTNVNDKCFNLKRPRTDEPCLKEPETLLNFVNRRRVVKYQRHSKPPYTYLGMMVVVIHSSKNHRLTLSGIHSALQDLFQFFRDDYRGWRDSVRHNLSFNSCFVKTGVRSCDRTKSGSYWTLDLSFVPPDAFKRSKMPKDKEKLWAPNLFQQLNIPHIKLPEVASPTKKVLKTQKVSYTPRPLPTLSYETTQNENNEMHKNFDEITNEQTGSQDSINELNHTQSLNYIEAQYTRYLREINSSDPPIPLTQYPKFASLLYDSENYLSAAGNLNSLCPPARYSPILQERPLESLVYETLPSPQSPRETGKLSTLSQSRRQSINLCPFSSPGQLSASIQLHSSVKTSDLRLTSSSSSLLSQTLADQVGTQCSLPTLVASHHSSPTLVASHHSSPTQVASHLASSALLPNRLASLKPLHCHPKTMTESSLYNQPHSTPTDPTVTSPVLTNQPESNPAARLPVAPATQRKPWTHYTDTILDSHVTNPQASSLPKLSHPKTKILFNTSADDDLQNYQNRMFADDLKASEHAVESSTISQQNMLSDLMIPFYEQKLLLSQKTPKFNMQLLQTENEMPMTSCSNSNYYMNIENVSPTATIVENITPCFDIATLTSATSVTDDRPENIAHIAAFQFPWGC